MTDVKTEATTEEQTPTVHVLYVPLVKPTNIERDHTIQTPRFEFVPEYDRTDGEDAFS